MLDIEQSRNILYHTYAEAQFVLWEVIIMGLFFPNT